MVTTKVMVVDPRRERYVLITARWNASSLASTALKLQNLVSWFVYFAAVKTCLTTH